MSKKRFIDIHLWEKEWFRDLDPKSKAFWLFICCKCDNTGVWKFDAKLIEFYIGEKLSLEEILETFKGKIALDYGRRIRIIKFVEFQYKRLSPTNVFHRSIIATHAKHEDARKKEAEKNNLSQEPAKPSKPKVKDKKQELNSLGPSQALAKNRQGPSQGPQEKEKDKDPSSSSKKKSPPPDDLFANAPAFGEEAPLAPAPPAAATAATGKRKFKTGFGPRNAELVAYFETAYQARYGHKPPVGKGGQGVIKRLLDQFDDVLRIQALIATYLAMNDKFYCDTAHEIRFLERDLAKIMAHGKKGKSPKYTWGE